ncbi:hypothetical protein Pst134EA_002828 [Puccinia striiformis f. sp. tritici]|uniref:hypothetical protein n=1 Tax=Puccinia striiformis f. sp. tritici TaxID=168172 RepID=UPI002007C9A9|nr:hypothetical protein Pst134EA_002828 [Puccinia striiformis f. sp. tritici]KAH9472205.1 hypothetical protein Pst134EA_002828 [Puccinia striiformis f. sp. tritici]
MRRKPCRIFHLPSYGYLCRGGGRPEPQFTSSSWSPLQDQMFNGHVHRVVFQDETVCLDGFSHSKAGTGKHLNQASIHFRAQQCSKSIGARSTNTMIMASPKTRADEAVQQVESIPSLSRSVSHARSLQRRADASAGAFTSLTPQLIPLLPTRPPWIFSIAQEMRTQVERNGVLDILKGKVICSMFYEPSIRTSASFEAAMCRLGGRVVSITADQSSTAKGESSADTIRTLGCYGDADNLRHPVAGSSRSAANVSPSRSSMQMTVLVNILHTALPEAIRQEVARAGVSFEQSNNLEEVIGKDRCALRDPGPTGTIHQNAEIDAEVDLDPLRAAYFRQMRYGLFVRMALLTLVLTP